jgi:hypothetical protein
MKTMVIQVPNSNGHLTLTLKERKYGAKKVSIMNGTIKKIKKLTKKVRAQYLNQ